MRETSGRRKKDVKRALYWKGKHVIEDLWLFLPPHVVVSVSLSVVLGECALAFGFISNSISFVHA